MDANSNDNRASLGSSWSDAGLSDFSFSFDEESHDSDDPESLPVPPASSAAHRHHERTNRDQEPTAGASFSVATEATISGKPYPARPTLIKIVQVPKLFENHTYRDFSEMPMDLEYRFPNSIEHMTFHERLYHLLTFSPVQYRQAICWCCHGRAFEFLHVDGLVLLGILRSYFGYNNIRRFRKQLSNHGYKQLTPTLIVNNERFYSEVSAPALVQPKLLADTYCCGLIQVPASGQTSSHAIQPAFHRTTKAAARS